MNARMSEVRRARGAALLLGMALACAGGDAVAANGERGASGAVAAAGTSRAVATAADVYADECGSCHMAYPARLLRSADWQVVLSNLDRHYGTNAALDAPTLARVATVMGVPAPTGAATRIAADALPRITLQPWFVREHGAARLARHGRASERLSQCDACHTDASQGRFEGDEHERGRAGSERRRETHEHEEHAE